MYVIWHVFLLWTLYYYCYSWWGSMIHCTLFIQSSVHLLTTLLFLSLFITYEMPANLVTTVLFHCDLQDVLINVTC